MRAYDGPRAALGMVEQVGDGKSSSGFTSALAAAAAAAG